MANDLIQEARGILEIVVGPEEIVEKVSEFGFKTVGELLKTNGFSEVPNLPSQEKLKKAKEENKALIFRLAKEASGQEINLAFLKDKFGGLIYSSWYLSPKISIATEKLSPGWALVDLDPLPDSSNKTYEEQISFVKEKGLSLKTPGADAYDLLVTFKATGKYFRKGPNNARTVAVVKEEPVKISHFDKGGMCISTGWGKTAVSPEIGATTEAILP